MDIDKTCTCLAEDIPLLNFNIKPVENEDLEETDEDELVEDQYVSDNIIWQKIDAEFNAQRQEIEDYKASNETQCAVPLNPAVQFLEENIFTIFTEVMVNTLNKAKELECVKHQKSTFNGIDYIAEMLWNMNPRHPKRKDNWTNIFDIKWVEDSLKNQPYYPLSWVWSKEYSATKIQAFMRGYWVRRRKDVQEMRQFWTVIKNENNLEAATQ